VQLAIIVLFGVPTLMALASWSHDISQNPSAENMQKGAEIMIDDVIPWWLGLFVWIAGRGGLLPVIGLLALAYFLKWVGEI